MTPAQLQVLTKQPKRTLHEIKEALHLTIIITREISRESAQKNRSKKNNCEGFKLKESLPDSKIISFAQVGLETWKNFIRGDFILPDTTENRTTLLHFINAALKAGLNRSLLETVIEKMKEIKKKRTVTPPVTEE